MLGSMIMMMGLGVIVGEVGVGVVGRVGVG